MIHAVKDLTPEQRMVVEHLLGHGVAENEVVRIESERLCEEDPSPEARLASADRLDRHFTKVAAQQKPASDDEFEAVLAEANHSQRILCLAEPAGNMKT